MRSSGFAGRHPGQREVDLPARRLRVVERDRRASRTRPRRSVPVAAPSRPAFPVVVLVASRCSTSSCRAAAARARREREHAHREERPEARRRTSPPPVPHGVALAARGPRRYVDAMVRTAGRRPTAGRRRRRRLRRARARHRRRAHHDRQGAARPTSTPRSTAALAAFESGVWSGRRATDRGRVLLRVADAAARAGRGRSRSPRPATRASRSATPAGRSTPPPARSSTTPARPTSSSARSCRCRTPGSTSCCASRSACARSSCRGTSRCSSPRWKTAPALACGNPVIIKPASLTPLTALMLGEILVEAGVPEGCVSVLPGPGRRRRRRARERPARRQDRVHRRDHDRRVDPARRRPTTSPGCRSSSAASRRASCSPTPTGSRRSPTPRWRCSATRARTAAPGAASWCEQSIYDDFVAAFARAHRGDHGRRRRSTTPPRWAR